MCALCWSELPVDARRDLESAWKAYQSRPGSLRTRHEYEVAIASAVGSIP